MKMTTKFYPTASKVADKYHIMANATIVIDNAFVIRGITIRENEEKDELYVLFPQYKQSDGKYHGDVYCISKDVKKLISDKILFDFAKFCSKESSKMTTSNQSDDTLTLE